MTTTLQIILITIGIIFIIEALTIILFTKQLSKALRELLKSNLLKKIGIFELIIGLLILSICFLFKIC